MVPGVTLAGLNEQAWAAGLGALDDDELAGVLCAWRRLSSWAAAGEAAAVTEFARRRTAAGPRAIEHLDDEIAALLILTGRSASRLTGIASSLARLPQTAAALKTGQLDWPRAVVIADETCCLSDAEAAAVEERILPAAPGQTTGQLRAAVRRAMLAIDAEAAIKRRKKAEKDARVETWNEAAGTSALAGRDLPPAHVIAADQHIDALARWLKAQGDDGHTGSVARQGLHRLAHRPAPRSPSPGGEVSCLRFRRQPWLADGAVRLGESDHALEYLAGPEHRARRGRRAWHPGRRRLPRSRRSSGQQSGLTLVPNLDRPRRACRRPWLRQIRPRISG